MARKTKKTKTDELNEEISNLKDKYLRLAAEFEKL